MTIGIISVIRVTNVNKINARRSLYGPSFAALISCAPET
jgi:hypothetical protein